MQEAIPAISGSVAFPARLGELEREAGAPRRVRFGDVMRSAFALFARQPGAILGAAFLCFAGVIIIGALLYCALILGVFFRSGSYFSATPGVFHLQMQVQAALGAFTFLLGRGAITWIALQDERVTLRQAFAAALKRWQPLLVSSLIYGALIALGMIGLTWMLRELRLDVSNYRWIRSDTNSIMNMVIVRVLSLLPPDPGSPFSELFSATRYNLGRMSSSYYGWSSYQLAARNLPIPYLLTGVGGLLLLFVTETLLCMRTAAIMRGSGGAFGWFQDTLRVAGRNFWRVALWRWSVRLAIMLLTAACLTLPIVLHQSLVVPTLVREVRSYWPYPINTSLYNIGIALAGMVMLAFSLVFEARMYAALSPASETQRGS
jgi:hypothetical protein